MVREVESRSVVVLPFDVSTFSDPSPLLPTVYRTLTSLPSSVTHFVILFASDSREEEQLYRSLRQSPISHWQAFQAFLGKIYACLAAAQWTSNRILLDVEVAFAGELVGGEQTGHELFLLEGGSCFFR